MLILSLIQKEWLLAEVEELVRGLLSYQYEMDSNVAPMQINMLEPRGKFLDEDTWKRLWED
jgi:hypothetical protein